MTCHNMEQLRSHRIFYGNFRFQCIVSINLFYFALIIIIITHNNIINYNIAS